MPSLGFSLFPFRFVNVYCELINEKILNNSFKLIAPLNDNYSLILPHIKCSVVL